MAELRDRSQLRSLTTDGVPRLACRDRGSAAASWSACAAPEPSLETAIGLIEGLVRSNLESMHIARELLAAQEAADAHTLEADRAIDAAAASDADPRLIDEAVDAVADAEAARSQEADLSTTWSMHRVAVYELITSAVRLLGLLPEGPTGRDRYEEAS